MDCRETSPQHFESFMGKLFEYANRQIINILEAHKDREETCMLYRTDSTIFINGTQCIAPTKIDNCIKCAWERLNIKDKCTKYCNTNGEPKNLQGQIEEMRIEVHNYCRNAHYRTSLDSKQFLKI